MTKTAAATIRLGILDARARKPYFMRTRNGGVVYLGSSLYRKAYQRTRAKMPPSLPPRGGAGGSRP